MLREAWEETGLENLRVGAFLGVQTIDVTPFGRNEVFRRHCFHLELVGTARERWTHFEQNPSDGGPPIEFELYWAAMPDDVPELAADMGAMLDSLAGDMR